MNDESLPYAQVMVPCPSLGMFTYSVPDSMRRAAMPGARVVAPFGGRSVIGVVASRILSTDVDTKPLAGVLDEAPVMTGHMLRLCLWISEYYFAPPGEVALLAIPKAASAIQATVRLTGMPEDARKSRGLDALKALEARGGERKLHLLAKDLGLTPAKMKTLLAQPNVKPFVEILYSGSITKASGGPLKLGAVPVQDVKLSPAQEAAVGLVAPDIREGKFGVTLLHGVTGSGKTEVYASLASMATGLGKSVLILAPEIAIAEMLSRRISVRTGREVVTLHSGHTPKERLERWLGVRDTAGIMIAGARSAVFAPSRDLGLIIVDEEHDHSYKQSDGPRYNGRDVAIKRGQVENIPVLLGAATPSMESYRNALAGKYKLAALDARIGNRPMPEVEVLTPEPGPEGLESKLKEEITLRLELGEQALLFLNRRGTARVVSCMRCGHAFKCLNCELSLVHHADQRKLRCHTCGYEQTPPDTCPECNATDFKETGAGTKKIEQELMKAFPAARTERLDQDTASKRTEPGRILARVEEGVVDVLIGTQMVTKGHDYPGITLVGVISADDSLNAPDFRAAERTFQQITQAAGRAGRGDKPGKVVVISRNPEHHSVQAAARHDFQSFFALEAPLREALGYPPYVRMAIIRIEAPSAKAGEDFLARMEPALRRMERELPGLVRLGPVDAVVFRVRNRYRWKIQLKAAGPALISQGVSRFLENAEKAASGVKGSIRFFVDVDPIDVM